MSFHTAVSGTSGSAPANTVAVSLAACAVGDACAIMVEYNSTTPTVTTPSGWTLLSGPNDNGVGSRTYLFGKILVSGDIASGVTFGLSTTSRVAAIGGAVSNPTVSPFGTPVHNSQSGTMAAVTTVDAGSITLHFASDTIATGAPTSLAFGTATKDSQAVTTNASGVNTAAAVGHRVTTTVGSYGGGTLTGGDALWQTYALEVEQAVAVMNAGADQTGIEPGATVTLDSSGSTGVSAGRTWSQVSGATVSLSSTTATSPTFTAPPELTDTTLVFRVTDNATSTSDDVSIGVLRASRRVKIGGVMTPVYRRVTLP